MPIPKAMSTNPQQRKKRKTHRLAGYILGSGAGSMLGFKAGQSLVEGISRFQKVLADFRRT